MKKVSLHFSGSVMHFTQLQLKKHAVCFLVLEARFMASHLSANLQKYSTLTSHKLLEHVLSEGTNWFCHSNLKLSHTEKVDS